MHILNVEVKDYAFSKEKGCHQATLLMEGVDSRVCLRTASTHAASANHKDVVHGLIADAIRQLKRMPEYRGNAREITVAQNAVAI